VFVDCLLKRFKLILFLVCGFLVLFAGTMAINAWSEPKTIGLMSNYEAVSITEIVFSSNNSSTLTLRNYGYTTSIINSASINGVAALLDTCQAPSGIPKNNAVNYIVTLPNGTQFNPKIEYTFKLVTTKGTSIIYSNVTYDSTTVIIGPSHTHSSNPIIAPSPKPYYYEFPDYSLPFTIAFALILLVILTGAVKFKSLRKYILILTPIGIAEFILLYKEANYPYLFLNSQFRLDRYGDFVFAISLVSIVGGVTIYLLSRIAPALVEKKIKLSLIVLGYTALSIGGIGLYLPWETGFSIVFRILTFIFGVYLSIIGTANYFINKPKESEVFC
jgi:hypothetical protein